MNTRMPRGLIIVAIATAMLCIVLSGAVEYWSMVRLDLAANVMRHGDTAVANAAEDMEEDVLELRRYEKDVFMNVGSADVVQQYREKWDRAHLLLLYDLQRARHAGSATHEAQLQQVIDRMGAYSAAFGHIYDSISNGTIRTTQQANDEMSMSKASVREAESILADIGNDARTRQPLLHPAVVAHRFSLALSSLLLLVLGAFCVALIRRWPSAQYA